MHGEIWAESLTGVSGIGGGLLCSNICSKHHPISQVLVKLVADDANPSLIDNWHWFNHRIVIFNTDILLKKGLCNRSECPKEEILHWWMSLMKNSASDLMNKRKKCLFMNLSYVEGLGKFLNLINKHPSLYIILQKRSEDDFNCPDVHIGFYPHLYR